MKKPINLGFLGQKPLGETCFDILSQAGDFNISFGVSNYSKENWWKNNGIYQSCRRLSIPFVDNSYRAEDKIAKLIKGSSCDFIISIQHSWILSKKLIDSVNGKAFNLHLAPLPEYQGWHGPTHAILENRKRFGVTLHWLTESVDKGEIAYFSEFSIFKDDTAVSLYQRAEKHGVKLFRKLIKDLASGKEPPRFQRNSAGRFYSYKELESFKDLTKLKDQNEKNKRIRALWFPPFEPAYEIIEGSKRLLSP